MNDWRIISIITLLASLMLVWSEFRTDHQHRVTGSFVVRSIAIWAVIILTVTVLVVYRGEIAAFFAPIRAMMP